MHPLPTVSVSGTRQKAVRTPRDLRVSRCGGETKWRGSTITTRTRTMGGARCRSRRVRRRTRSQLCFLARIRRCGVCTRQEAAFALCAEYGYGSWLSAGLELTLRAMLCQWRRVVRAVEIGCDARVQSACSAIAQTVKYCPVVVLGCVVSFRDALRWFGMPKHMY